MFQHILLPVDLANLDSQDKAIDAALNLAGASGAKIHLMTVLPSFGEGVVSSFFPADYQERAIKEADEALVALESEKMAGNDTVSHSIAVGRIYEQILKTQEQLSVDLIVMASHQPDVKDYLLGPNASRVARHAACSVLIVRD